MEASVDKLEALFRKSESNLNYISRKLDNDIEEQLGKELNPAELARRLQKVKKEYASLQTEAEEIKKLQAEMSNSFKSQLQATCMALQHLSTSAPGSQDTGSTEQKAMVESLLKMSLNNAPNQTTSSVANGSATQEEAKSRASEETEAQKQEMAASPPALSPAEQRKHSTECIEVTEEEFQSVSSLVRGRATLADVNKVYKVLFRHFKEEGNTKMLTIQDMTKMGLRITGNTGEAKLRVLRSLKILQITKIGSVKLL